MRIAATLLLFVAFSVSSYGQAPLVDVTGAVSEFISSDEGAQFVVRGIRCYGRVDTLKVSVKTSTVRAIGESYARYKPIADSVVPVRRNADTTDILVYMHLTGRGFPLPPDSVRGTVRLTVSAAWWNGSDWLGTTSESFTVPIANVSIPKPLIDISRIAIQPRRTNTGVDLDIDGIVLRMPAPDSVDLMPDVREFTMGDPLIDIAKKGGKHSITAKDLTLVRSDNSRYWYKATISLATPPGALGSQNGEEEFAIKVRATHRGVTGPMRIRTFKARW